jgi:hypothetical protein
MTLFGGIPLVRQRNAVLIDRTAERVVYPRKELPLRPLHGGCEICQQPGNIVMHHVRRLTDLGQPGPEQPTWAALMAKRRRKTLAVCETCHQAIHAETLPAILTA